MADLDHLEETQEQRKLRRQLRYLEGVARDVGAWLHHVGNLLEDAAEGEEVMNFDYQPKQEIPDTEREAHATAD